MSNIALDSVGFVKYLGEGLGVWRGSIQETMKIRLYRRWGREFFSRVSIRLSCYGIEKSQKFLVYSPIEQENRLLYSFSNPCHAKFLGVIIYIVLFKYGLRIQGNLVA